MKLTAKFVLSVSLTTLVSIGVLMLVTNFTMQKVATYKAEIIATETASHYAEVLSGELESALHEARALADAFESFVALKDTAPVPRDLANRILKRFIEDNEEYLTVFAVFEPDAYDGLDALYRGTEGHDDTGRFVPFWSRNDSGKGSLEPMKYYDVPGFGDFYLKPKNNLRETVIEPRQQVIMGKGTLVSSLAIPVFETKGYQNFAGVVGIDLDIGNLHRKVKDFRLYETGYLMLFSNQGIIVGGTDENQLGTSIRTLTDNTDLIELLDRDSAESFMLSGTSILNGKRSLIVGMPVEIGLSNTYWKAVVTIPYDEINADVRAISRRILLFGLLAIVLMVLLVWFLSRLMLRHIIRVTSILEGISMGEGDLTQAIHVRGKDEVGKLAQYFNTFIEKLSSIVFKIKGASAKTMEVKNDLSASTEETLSAITEISESINNMKRQIGVLDGDIVSSSSAMEQINRAIDTLGKEIEEQASAVEESTAAVNEMVASLHNVADITRKKKISTDKLVHTAKRGGEKLEQTSAVIQDVNANIDRIQEMADIINSIASQTNLLSMNAAIEAAHAGEYGKGFSVVADEIRKLAETSAENAMDISKILKDVVDKIEAASAYSAETMQVFEEISGEVDEVAHALDEISLSANELSQGGKQIIDAMNTLNSISVHVKEGSGEMMTGTKEVSAAMENVRRISGEVLNGMNEIASGASEITAAMVDVSSITGVLAENADILAMEVARFKTREEAEAEAAQETRLISYNESAEGGGSDPEGGPR